MEGKLKELPTETVLYVRIIHKKIIMGVGECTYFVHLYEITK